MKDQILLNVEELEERIAPDGIGGTPGTGTSNSNGEGTEVSGGNRPQPEPGRKCRNGRPPRRRRLLTFWLELLGFERPLGPAGMTEHRKTLEKP